MRRLRHPPARKPRGAPEPTAPAARKATAAAPLVYIPPAGFPADPRDFLAYLQAGSFTAPQIAYLRSNALTQYVSAINNARGMPGLSEAVALGDQIIAGWIAALAVLGPAPASNPFGIA